MPRRYVLAISVILATATTNLTLGQTPVNPDAATLDDFQKRVKAYAALRAKTDDGAPPLKETKEPAEITAAEKARATRIKAARSSARQGEIFTPEVEKLFRRLLVWEVKGPSGRTTKHSMGDEKPMVPLVVNGQYPKEEPLATVPPNILASLPKLPDGLEYRFVRRHLILRDTQANLIVDFVLNALPQMEE